MEWLKFTHNLSNLVSLKTKLRLIGHSVMPKLYRNVLLSFAGCDLCGARCTHYLQLCDHCYHDLPLFQEKLVQGDLLNWPAIHHNLPHIVFDHLICLAPHQTPFNQWISQLKYQGRFEIAQLLGHLLAEKYALLLNHHHITKPTMVIAVPLHISRWQHRGFNQAHLIAKQFIKHLPPLMSLNYCTNLIGRTKNTDHQVGQSGRQRRHNLSNSFSLNLETIKTLPQHVLLFDDVVTTGTTASEISNLLKQHGVKKVTLMTVTISLPSS